MKLILAIVNHEDAGGVIRHLTQEGYSVTKMASTGGFLMMGNVTILVGLDDEKVGDAMEIIRRQSISRRQIMPATPEVGLGLYPTIPVEVTVGGATVFVLDVDAYHKF